MSDLWMSDFLIQAVVQIASPVASHFVHRSFLYSAKIYMEHSIQE